MADQMFPLRHINSIQIPVMPTCSAFVTSWQLKGLWHNVTWSPWPLWEAFERVPVSNEALESKVLAKWLHLLGITWGSTEHTLSFLYPLIILVVRRPWQALAYFNSLLSRLCAWFNRMLIKYSAQVPLRYCYGTSSSGILNQEENVVKGWIT